MLIWCFLSPHLLLYIFLTENMEHQSDRWPSWLWRQVKVTLIIRSQDLISWSRKWRGFESHSVQFFYISFRFIYWYYFFLVDCLFEGEFFPIFWWRILRWGGFNLFYWFLVFRPHLRFLPARYIRAVNR